LERAERIHHAWAIGASLHDMTNAARLATDVVRSTKSLAVPSALRQQQDIRIGESIRKALALLGSPLRRVNVVLELEESLPTIRAGRSELVQIWSNLIRNAIESMAAGQTPDPTLTIRGHEEKEYIVVEITDNGPGIPPEIRERIFQPDFTTKGKGLTFGLGLGLPIVERIVSAYNGGVAVRSRPGETVFTVTLPLGEQHE